MPSSASKEQFDVLAPVYRPDSTNPWPEEKNSYSQILKSSALIGGSSALNIVIGIARTKALAVLLGPAGFGLTGLYTSVADITQGVAGMGINSSGVRQIAEAAGTGESERIAQTAAVLKRTALLFGMLGAAFLMLFSGPISRLTFGDTKHSGALCLLSAAVLLRSVSAGQGALIQGMRRISDLAQMGVWGAIFGFFSSLGFIYFLRERGIVPSLVSVAAMTVLTSWWYSRKISIPAVAVSSQRMACEAASLLRLGFAFMASSFFTVGAAYAVRILLLRQAGLEATGAYQAAWTLGGLYVGFILQAMGADFYPRLTARIHDHVACNRIVNEQTRVGLLLAGPGVIATLTLTPLVVALFYSAKFHAAVGILRWICLGSALQVISWPMGFIILAKAKRLLFMLSDFSWALVYVGLTWLLVKRFGKAGIGIAFFGSYIYHALVTYAIVHRLSGFRWSGENRMAVFILSPLIVLAFFANLMPANSWNFTAGLVALVAGSFFSLYTLLTLIPSGRLPCRIQAALIKVRYIPALGKACR